MTRVRALSDVCYNSLLWMCMAIQIPIYLLIKRA